MNRRCLIAGCLRHSFCRSSRRCRKKNIHAFHLKILNNGIDRRGFSGTRTSGDNQKPIFHCLNHCISLQFIQFQLIFLFNVCQPFPNRFFIFFRLNIQFTQPSRCIQFQIIVLAAINDPFRLRFSIFINCTFHRNFFYYHFPLNGKIHNMFFHMLWLHSKKLRSLCQKYSFRQINMPVLSCQRQRIKQTTSDPIIGIGMNPDSSGNLICNPETDSLDIFCQLIWILLQYRIDTGTIFSIDLHTETDGNTILLQKHHCTSHL